MTADAPGPRRDVGYGHIQARDTMSRSPDAVLQIAVVRAFHDTVLSPVYRERRTTEAELIARAPVLQAENERLRAALASLNAR